MRERELARRYQCCGDLQAREELIERFLPLARNLAFRYRHADEPLDDLIQVASLGLIEAVDRFDPGKGTKFTSYATPTIIGQLKRHFRDRGWALHVPRDLQERALDVGRATDQLTARLGRSPGVKDIAKELGRSREEILEAIEAGRTHDTVSLDASTSTDETSAALVEMIGSPDSAFGAVEELEAVTRTWRTLPALEREVVRLRVGEDLTQGEIGERIGVSQMQVSRLLRRALERLRPDARVAA